MVSKFLKQCHEGLHSQVKGLTKTLQGLSGDERESVIGRRLVVLTGCGDSLAVASYGVWALLQEGVCAISVSPPDLQRLPLDNSCTVIGVSASGRSISTMRAIEYAKRCGATTVALTDNEQGRINETVDSLWLTNSGVETYDIIPTAPTTCGMAFILGVVGQINPAKYGDDLHVLQRLIDDIWEWAELEGLSISQMIDVNRRVTFVADGPCYVSAELGVMKISESSLTYATSVPTEEFQHYGGLSTKRNDLVIFVTEKRLTAADARFLNILRDVLGLRTYHLHPPETISFTTSMARVIPNVMAIQIGTYYTLVRVDPERKWFRLPHARAFKIY